MDTHVVIMAGGIGSRFWPMSTPSMPKQFVDVMGVGKTLIQMTVDRFAPICPKENFWVVTGEKYVDLVCEQLPDIPRHHILAEPAARNTAPCIAYACWKIREHHPDANVVVTPSDALVLNADEFRRKIQLALDFTDKEDRIATIGIRPSRPETGYGYIKTGELASEGICKVDSFREKPSLEVAKEYLADGGYLWNAGIFIWNVKTITSALCRYVPGLTAIMEKMAESFYTPSETETVKDLFPTCEKISIDYAVMEKADNIYTVPSDFGWSDLGTWGALWTLKEQDENGNAVVGEDIRLFDCRNCIIHTPDIGHAVIQGLEDCIVSKHGDRLLICRKERDQKITDYIKD